MAADVLWSKIDQEVHFDQEEHFAYYLQDA